MFIRNVITLILFSSFLVFSSSLPSNAQGAEKPHEPMYKILAKFPVNVSNKYVFKEESKITRIYSNGTSKDYRRELVYHFSLRAPSAVNKEGFQLIEATVDSLEYKFTSPDTTIYFNDQRDDLRPPKLDDYNNKMVVLGLDFQMTYSPYQEVAKFGGEMLLEKRNYLTDPKTAPQDELNKATWVNGLEDESLLNYFDVVKGITPMHRVDIDSSWDKAFIVDLEGGRFIDSVTFTLTNFNIQNYTIKGISKGFTPKEKLVRLFGLSQLIDYTNAEGSSEYTIKMHPKGSVTEINAKYNAILTYQVANDYIQQKVETNRTWTLEKMYNW